MNVNNVTQQQPAQAGTTQQQPSAPRLPSMYTPEQMNRLPPHFNEADKKKYVQGLTNLWAQMTSNPEDSPMHVEAKKKIMDFSNNLNKNMMHFRQQANAQANASGQGEAARPTSQGRPSQAHSDPNTTAASSSSTQQARPQAKMPTQVPQHVVDHVNSFPFTLPPQYQKGSDEAHKWLQDSRNRLTRALMTMEFATNHAKRTETLIQQRNASGSPLTAEEMQKIEGEKEKLTKNHADAKQFVENFRKSQEQLAASIRGQQAGPPTRPSLNTQQPNPTQTVTAAFDVARVMQGANRAGLGPQAGNQAQQASSSSFTNMTQHAGMGNVKQEGGQQGHALPNHVQQMNRATGNNNSSPQSANPPSAASANGGANGQQQQPRALTHQAALTQAARTYSSGQTTGTPGVMGHSHTHPNIARNGSESDMPSIKLPIPKHLPERAQQPATPVGMPPSRPTLSGGPSMSNQAMQQPVIQARPSYEFGEDGDRVLSKKKLDELVRQVTGGGDGAGEGDLSLTPEVEESILNVADDFVDQVLHSACQLAKVRGSDVLEIRDIQLVLERNYNIRIPGYASDEIRTVRKFQPAPGWVSKMSAVQAAKVRAHC